MERVNAQITEAPADAVGDRPADELPDRQAGQEQGERQLHRPAADVQVPLDRRERRQVHVDAQRAEGIEQSEEEDEAERGAGGLPARGRRGVVEGHPWISGRERRPVGELGGGPFAVQRYRTVEGKRPIGVGRAVQPDAVRTGSDGVGRDSPTDARPAPRTRRPVPA